MATVLVDSRQDIDIDELVSDAPTAVAAPARAGIDGGACRLRERLQAAFDLEDGDQRLVRLGLADTSVTFEVDGEPHVTVLLDRCPPIVTGGDEPAEVTIVLDRQQADDLSLGQLSLPPLLHARGAGYRGPVRRYLMVDAVLRGLLAKRADAHR